MVRQYLGIHTVLVLTGGYSLGSYGHYGVYRVNLSNRVYMVKLTYRVYMVKLSYRAYRVKLSRLDSPSLTQSVFKVGQLVLQVLPKDPVVATLQYGCHLQANTATINPLTH